MSLPLTFDLHGTLLKGAIGDIFASNGIPLTIRLAGTMAYTPPREISCPIPLNFGLNGSLSYGIEGSMAFTLPMLTVRFDSILSAEGSLQITLPMLTVNFSAHDSIEGALSFTIPKQSVKFTGWQEIEGALNVILPIQGVKLAGFVNENGVLNVTIPMLRFTGTAEGSNEGVLSFTIPSYRISFDGYSSTEGDLHVTIPMLLFHAEQSIGSDDYLTMVMNTKNKALTLFNNYLFNSLCAFNGKHFGATDTGIFDLDAGTKDNGVPIEWNFKTGYLDLEQKRKKKLVQAWTSYKTDGDIKFTLVQPDGGQYEYILQGIDTTETGLRVKFGKGIRTKYVALNVSNIDGSSIDLDELKLHLATSNFVKVR
jgi:hypothetical protein